MSVPQVAFGGWLYFGQAEKCANPAHPGREFGGLIADKAFQIDQVIDGMIDRGARIVISENPRRAQPMAIDNEICKWRHLIESFLGKFKEFKRIPLRSDKTDISVEATNHACSAINSSR